MSVVAFVLACGRSTRFPGLVPKQFIEFSYKKEYGWEPWPMYRNALCMVDVRERVLVTLMEYSEFVNPVNGWRNLFLERSNGQAETVMRAITMSGVELSDASGFLFVNCDNGFAPGVLDRLVNYCEEWERPGALTMEVHADEEHRWSFVDGHPRFFNAYEKKCVHLFGQKPRALAGAYYFPRGYVRHLELTCLKVVGQCRDREPQMSEVLSNMAVPLHSVNIIRDEFYDWGTAKSFQQFLENQ